MPGDNNITEPVFEHITKTCEFMGQVKERLDQGDKTMQSIVEQQQKLATKDEVFEKVDAGIADHVQAYHPDQATIVGEQVLARRAMLKEWIMGHPKASGIIGAVGSILAAVLAEWKGVI